MPGKRGQKRNLSPSQASGSKPKRPRKAPPSAPDPDVIVIDSDSEPNDLKAILAQIKAQEDDEAMAKRLAEEWTHEDEFANLEKRVGEFPMDLSDMEGKGNYPCASHDASTSSNYHSKGTCPVTDTDSSNFQSGSKSYASVSVRPDEGLEPFRQIFTKIRACSKCGKDVPSPRGCVIFSASLLPPTLTHLLHAPCKKCRTNHCRGCFTPLSCRATCKGSSKNNSCSITQCCAEIRAIAVFEVLGAFDRQFLGERATANSRVLANVAYNDSAFKGNSVGPGGTGYGTDEYTGSRRSKSKAPAISDVASHWEEVVVHALATLTELLPAPYADNPQVYDLLPHVSIGHLLSLSQIPILLADLLRNDSVTDWISRKETIQCLIGQRWEMDKSCDLENWMWEDGEITKQSEAFLGGAMQMLDGEGDSEDDVDDTMIQGTSLCGDIIAARDALERAITLLGLSSSNLESNNRATQASGSNQTRLSSKGKGKDRSISIDKAYIDACEQLAFKHVSLGDASSTNEAGLNYTNYNYAQQLNQTQNATRLPKSRLHLVKELAVTATSLPAGVWVRVDEVRNDAIKIMIAGPDDTPYAGGLFEFDCFMPMEYPNLPPLMHLRTTGGGSVRFNPNLYQCGKVCLSLLGTWPGRPEEQWSPNSTLLQVLVSIQSMILIDAPYYNEPGYGKANLKSPASIAYNRNISAQTIRWAIVDWLRDAHRQSIWREVIASHFTIYKDKIRQKILDWHKEESQIPSYVTPYSSQYRATQKVNDKGLDLLEEFDKGMKIVESWKVGDEVE